MATWEKDSLRKGRWDIFRAIFLASRDIYLIHLNFNMEFDFKDKNVLYIISVNVLSFDLCIKDTLQLNIHLLADWSQNILFQNNEISIPQKVSDGQDQQGILIFC